MKYPILIVDDNRLLVHSLSEFLFKEKYLISKAFTFKDAKNLIKKNHFCVIILDLKLPDGSGAELASLIYRKNPNSKIILITAYETDIPDFEENILCNIFDYLPKPFNLSHATKRIKNALELYLLEDERRNKIYGNNNEIDKIIAKSSKMKEVKKIIKKSSEVNSPVLITGETGTGKELVARAIHFSSNYENNNFIPVNCSAIPENLFESEFFGYEKGAFTGAEKRKLGLFELANRGTLFLDEIGELPIEFQSKLLRVLETKEIRRLGSEETVKIQVRIIAATNKNLEYEIRNGNSFREDLFYRLSVIRIKLPPLRERKEDILPITTHLWKNITLKMKKNVPLPNEQFLNSLIKKDWPGNVRELTNYLERIIILHGIQYNYDENFEKNDISFNFETLETVTKKHILKTYINTNKNKTQTAKKLDISLSKLKRKLKEYKIN